jgi:tetratricopeptide (TPR) repeat protein
MLGMFGRTERLLRRGQRALARREFAQAEALLREALARRPAEPHLLVHLARALAEQEQLDAAQRTLDEAIALAPASFVAPLHRALVRLDAGDAAGAQADAQRAAALAPGNRLVVGYAALVQWIAAGGPPPPALAGLVIELPHTFGARALLRLAETTLARRGGRAALALLEPPPEPVGLPVLLWLGARRHRDRLAYAEWLLARGRHADAACTLLAAPPVDDPRVPAVLERARRGALRALDDALVQAAPARRADLLLERYEIEHELGDEAAVVRTLTEWHRAWEGAGAPAARRAVAAAVVRRLAAAEVERGRFAEALRLCADSRVLRAERETAGVEAVARLGLGERRAARQRFEDFLCNSLFPLDIKVREAAEGSTA